MPATFPPIDDELLAGVRSGDERALERLFRDHFDALTYEAKQSLDDAFFAPKVVESVFVRAWARRAEFDSPSALERFLHESVHEAAIRDNGRRAALRRHPGHDSGAHRAVHQSAPPSVDDAWARLSAAIHAGDHATPAEAGVKARRARHATAEHMANVARRRSPLATAAYMLGIVGVVAGLLYSLFRDTPEKKTGRLLASADAHEIMTKYGQVGTTTLDDGSKATIGADSKLRIPPGYGTQVRAVRVAGTASFQVAPGHALPFEVRVGNAAVIATGTTFAVAFDTGAKIVTIRVAEGAVNVRAGTNQKALAAGQSMLVDDAGTMKDGDPNAVAEALGWIDGKLVIHDRTLRQALELARRWYSIALIPSDMALMERKVSVDAPLESSREMIADLESSGSMQFGWEDKTMVLYDASAKRKK